MASLSQNVSDALNTNTLPAADASPVVDISHGNVLSQRKQSSEQAKSTTIALWHAGLPRNYDARFIWRPDSRFATATRCHPFALSKLTQVRWLGMVPSARDAEPANHESLDRTAVLTGSVENEAAI